MKGKGINAILLSLVFLMSFMLVGQINGNTNVQMIIPDVTTDEYAVEFFTEFDAGTGSGTLPTLEPFWTDIVNTERVEETGEDVYVAVLDTGLLPQWDFFFSEANIAADLGVGFTHDIFFDSSGNLVVGPLKQVGFVTELASGHGTHVTSTIVGFNLNNQVWVDGIAPEATIIPVRVLDAWDLGGGLRLSGGFNDMIAAGIMYVADLADELDGKIIINMSLGGPNPSQLIEDAINYAISKGVIVVASAGNSGFNGMGYPGAFSQVISVGAGGWTDMFTNWWDTGAPEQLNVPDSLGNEMQLYLEDFSSRPNPLLGQTTDLLDVTAPGAWVVGPFKSSFRENTGYYFLSGTSMAAPHISGIAALVAEEEEDVTQAQMEILLKIAASGEDFNAFRGFPFIGNDVKVAFPFIPGGFYTVSWGLGEFGTGFIDAEVVMELAHELDDDDDGFNDLIADLLEKLEDFYEDLFED
ncbi:MAG: hypothetical protein D6732_28180 [Methanobacteriota archaeon]|nr:MAG: hypothetical protein D6732_28180 [Euryarchaeota archaeon]